MGSRVLLLSRNLLHNSDMDEYVTLHYRDVAPMRPFHSASVTLKRRGEASVARHRHDFHEMMLVVEGAGLHWLNDRECPVVPGEFFLLRPEDRHGISLGGRPRLHFMNVAFPSDSWRDFSALALSSDGSTSWRAKGNPAIAHFVDDRFDSAVSSFHRLSQFADHPNERLELMRFWMEISTLILGEATTSSAPKPKGPVWLERALSALTGADALRAGVPALVTLSGVSAAHLSRTLKNVRGVTPTEFVNSIRLRRAAVLLANSSMEIVDIAPECGFENLSYFYRQFHAAYGRAPRAYRIIERSRIAPQGHIPTSELLTS